MVDEKKAAPDKAVRVPVDLLERAVRLVPKLQATPWGDALRWNETALVRLALSRGLAVLEDELADEDELVRRGALGRPATMPAKPKKAARGQG